MKDNLALIKQAWDLKMESVRKSDWSQKIMSGDMKISAYMGFLQETYHHTKWNPQLQAYCSMFLKNFPRDVYKLFFKHAISEIGHDLMALEDAVGLGADRSKIIESKPLPQTVAFNGFPIFLMNFDNPLGYLGYLFHLEFLPTQNGRKYIELLRNRGIPESSLTFLEEHATVDVGHVKMMEKYIESLIVNKDDLDAVIYAVEGSAELHSAMIQASFDNGEKIFNRV